MKKLFCIIATICLLLTLAGCTTSLSYTFNVETGDAVKVKLDTTDGYKLTSDIPFEIKLKDETLSSGTFVKGDAYYQYKDVVTNTIDADNIETGKTGDNEYIYWTTGNEWNYCVLLKGGKTAILLGNNVSGESAKECFKRLTITVES